MLPLTPLEAAAIVWPSADTLTELQSRASPTARHVQFVSVVSAMCKRCPAAAATTTEPVVLLATARQSAPLLALRVMSCQLPSLKVRRNRPEAPLPKVGEPAAAINREPWPSTVPSPVRVRERQLASRRTAGEMAVTVSSVNTCKAPRWIRLPEPSAERKDALVSPSTVISSPNPWLAALAVNTITPPSWRMLTTLLAEAGDGKPLRVASSARAPGKLAAAKAAATGSKKTWVTAISSDLICCSRALMRAGRVTGSSKMA